MRFSSVALGAVAFRIADRNRGEWDERRGSPLWARHFVLHGQRWTRQLFLHHAAPEKRRKSPACCSRFSACVRGVNESKAFSVAETRPRWSHILELPNLIRRRRVRHDPLMPVLFFGGEAVVPFVFIWGSLWYADPRTPRNANEGTFVSALKERGEENEEAFWRRTTKWQEGLVVRGPGFD